MSEQAVPVHVNRSGPGSIEASATDVETRDSFVLHVRNHGDPVHVHVQLGGPLAAIADVEAGNHYVSAGENAVVPVAIEPREDAVTGTIELSSKFGAQTASIQVVVPGGPRPVDVDERLAEPGRRPRAPESDDDRTAPPLGQIDSFTPGPGTLGLLALAVVAIAIAVAAAVVVGGTPALIGSLVVGGGILTALAVLLR